MRQSSKAGPKRKNHADQSGTEVAIQRVSRRKTGVKETEGFFGASDPCFPPSDNSEGGF